MAIATPMAFLWIPESKGCLGTFVYGRRYKGLRCGVLEFFRGSAKGFLGVAANLQN